MATKKKALTREQIFHSRDCDALEPVEIPEWGGTIYMARITVGEWEKLIALAHRDAKAKNGDPGLTNARAVCASARDEQGNRIFEDPTVDDTHARILAGKSFVAVDRAYEAYARVNGRGKETEAELKKNSAGTPASDSSSS